VPARCGFMSCLKPWEERRRLACVDTYSGEGVTACRHCVCGLVLRSVRVYLMGWLMVLVLRRRKLGFGRMGLFRPHCADWSMLDGL